ncbi:MAG: hypothetical protein U0441_00620 [Polyangiaceae bacterium]
MRSLIAGVALSLFSASLMACTAPDTTDGQADEEEVGSAQEADRGSSGSNGLIDFDYLVAVQTVYQVAKTYPLVVSGTKTIHPSVINALYVNGAGKNILKYAVACAAPEGVPLYDGTDFLTGRGHLISGAAWMNGALSAAAVNSLMACIAVHVNPYGVTVPILLMGGDVQDDTYAHSGFDVQEAFWTSNPSPASGLVSITVWPSAAISQKCSNPLSAFKNRICGQHPNSPACNLTLGTTPCTVDSVGNRTCGGQPAIETRLNKTDFDFLYKICGG